jgi:DNA-binding LacI/PurR family transcriptional regulator
METKLKSIDDIARIAGVSKSTVSRALNDSPLVNEETKRKILAIANEHSFRPSALARSLSLNSSRTIAFVTHAYTEGECECCISDPFSLEILGGITVGLHELGYDLLVVHIDPKSTDWARAYLDSGRVDGFILMTSERKRSHVEELLRIGAPFIVWGEGRKGAYSGISSENRKGGRIATDWLISLGRKRVAFLGGPKDDAEVQARFEGYSEALAAAGRKPDPRLVVHGDFGEKSGAKAAAELLSRDPGIDALFSNSDLMAMAAMRVFASRGRRVPEDIAVVGYDNLSLASYTTPALTTVSQNIPLAGRLIAKNIVARIEGGVISESQVPVELILRESA